MDLTSLKQTPPWEWPDSAGAALMRILEDHRSAATDRITAAELAGEITVIDDRVAAQLLSIVQSADEPEQLRAQAAISLGPALEEADTEGFDDELSEPPITKRTFERVQTALREIHFDHGVPKEVRRRALEASVRAPQDWHADAIREANSSSDDEWKLTAIFCMRWIRGFDAEILEMLESRNVAIHREAVRAAGNWGVDAAWPHISKLLTSQATEKGLLLDAIGAAVWIRPTEAKDILTDLADSDDGEIAEAASNALMEADGGEFNDEEDENFPF